MTTPIPTHPGAVPSIEEFRNYVGAGDAPGSNEEALERELAAAVELLDDFCQDPYRPIPDSVMKRWYLKVGAEMFDDQKGPSTYTDRFENVVQARSSRDPLNVVMREVRRYVSFI
ncbi:hypothetical protein [Rhodococcus sp. B10]|uniref:hypothetical protein n=1 Tax=Rhodococcus sp. B10 TaxID=2695876 RepID=UPI0014300774|nr:hypothetical protein [Rhodococcus sp. B10]NIL76790.1 hypothetical protein [Rhodococcus sp. B10]